jgi:hypothetical protein
MLARADARAQFTGPESRVARLQDNFSRISFHDTYYGHRNTIQRSGFVTQHSCS